MRDVGTRKAERFVNYVRLFPELAGQLVFFGDDGQADFAVAALALLKQKTKVAGSNGGHKFIRTVAFVAIHAVRICCSKMKRGFPCSGSMNHAGIVEGGVGGGREEGGGEVGGRWEEEGRRGGGGIRMNQGAFPWGREFHFV